MVLSLKGSPYNTNIIWYASRDYNTYIVANSFRMATAFRKDDSSPYEYKAESKKVISSTTFDKVSSSKIPYLVVAGLMRLINDER